MDTTTLIGIFALVLTVLGFIGSMFRYALKPFISHFIKSVQDLIEEMRELRTAMEERTKYSEKTLQEHADNITALEEKVTGHGQLLTRHDVEIKNLKHSINEK